MAKQKPPGTVPPKPPRRRPPPPPNPDDNPGGTGGRPPKWDPDRATAILDLVQNGQHPEIAAGAVGVSPRTLRRWMQMGRLYPNGDYGVFVELLFQAEKQSEVLITSSIREAARFNTDDAKWFAERRHGDRWGRYVAELDRLRKLVRESAAIRERMQEEIEFLRGELAKLSAGVTGGD